MTNVEIVKAMYAAFAKADLQGILIHVAEDVSWEAEGPAELKFTGIRRGVQETAGFFAALAQEQKDPDLRMTEFVSEGDSVAVFGRYAATIKNGRRVDSPVGHLFKFRNGKVVRFVDLLNTAAFLESSHAAQA